MIMKTEKGEKEILNFKLMKNFLFGSVIYQGFAFLMSYKTFLLSSLLVSFKSHTRLTYFSYTISELIITKLIFFYQTAKLAASSKSYILS